ncbi:hypothetical protein [Buchnera aphidicola]|uniref:hypothetical protein n=1 Tax=Buchnera aphidicola TaxID=9 RepID=UPI00046D13B4|nr:hypothetical protein [Buchnera aphidicola]WAI02935.1 MAG: hypothetical protein OW722_02080 [Buchnera aphidicola (Myzus persicae)]
MSSHLLFNSTDKIQEKPIDRIKIDLKQIQKILNRKKNVTKNNSDKKVDFSKYKENLINLKKSYEDSIVLLRALEKYREKKILKKYDIKNIYLFEKDSKNIVDKKNYTSLQNLLMKKKFLTIPLQTS